MLNTFCYYHVLFQWTYRAGNSWGTDPDGTSCVGCGNQEHFRACADITIGDGGNPQNPPTTTPVVPVPTTTGNIPISTPDSTDSPTNAPCGDKGTGNYKRVCCESLKNNYFCTGNCVGLTYN